MNHIISSVKLTHAGHVILQLICEKLWSKMSLQAFQPHTLPILTSQLCLVQRATPRNGVTPLPYLEKYARYLMFTIFTNFELPLGNFV